MGTRLVSTKIKKICRTKITIGPCELSLQAIKEVKADRATCMKKWIMKRCGYRVPGGKAGKEEDTANEEGMFIRIGSKATSRQDGCIHILILRVLSVFSSRK